MSSDSATDAGEQPVKLVERGVEVRGVRLASAMNDASRALLARAPLIILPAAAFAWQDYTPILEHFGRERRVFALDWPGFGASEKPAPDAFIYNSASYAEMLAGWMDGLGIASAVLLGNGIGAGLGVRGAINSPTFTLLKEYQGRLPLYHFDLYRIEDPEELFTLGFEDYFGGEGVCVVEWAERGVALDGATLWPASWLRIQITADDAKKRTLTCSALSARGEALLRALMDAATQTTEVMEGR